MQSIKLTKLKLVRYTFTTMGMGEVLVILLLALVVVGPKDLPKIARWLARSLRGIRNMMNEFSTSLGVDEEIKEVREAGSMLQDTIRSINPVTELADELQNDRRLQ